MTIKSSFSLLKWPIFTLVASIISKIPAIWLITILDKLLRKRGIDKK